MKMRYRCSDAETSPAATAKTTTTRAKSRARLSNSPSCRRAASPTLRPSYGMGMWRAVALLACLTATTHAALFSEGGALPNGEERYYKKFGPEERKAYEDLVKLEEEMFPDYEEKWSRRPEAAEEMLANYEKYFGRIPVPAKSSSHSSDEKEEPAMTKSMETIIMLQREIEEEARQEMLRNAKEREQKAPLAPEHHEALAAEKPFDFEDLLKGELMLEEKIASESDLKNTQENLAQETDAVKANVESLESAMQTATGEPQVPQKKGQNEFVSFVEPEPQPAKQTVSGQSIDKRRLATSAEYSGNAPRYSSSSLLLLAVGTVMCVGLIGTVAGGTYYYNNRRRTETPDDGEYAPYAGTGPGFRKNKGNKGDETLAYKAQLHQYQQAKQKIICGEDAPGIIESDGEDGADEENNYSVYECPGLAPTGDIEVCNPNFAAQP